MPQRKTKLPQILAEATGFARMRFNHLLRKYYGWRRLAEVGKYYRLYPPGTRDMEMMAAVLADVALDFKSEKMLFLALRALTQYNVPKNSDVLYWYELGRLAMLAGRPAEGIRIAEHVGALRAARVGARDLLSLGLRAAATGRDHIEVSIFGFVGKHNKAVLLDFTVTISWYLRRLPVRVASELFPFTLIVALELYDSIFEPTRRSDPIGLSSSPWVRWWNRRKSVTIPTRLESDCVHIWLKSDALSRSITYRARWDSELREGDLGSVAGWTPKDEPSLIGERNVAYSLFDFHVESRLLTADELCAPVTVLRIAGVIINTVYNKLDRAGQRRLLVLYPVGTLAHVPWAAAWTNGHYLIETRDIAIDDGLALAVTSPRTPQLIALAGISDTMRREAASIAGLAVRAQMPASHHLLTRAALQEALINASVVHLATHFRAHPHISGESELQMADGSWVRLEEVVPSLDGLELLFLAGCETGIEIDDGDGPGGNLVQPWRRAGAQSVISTLWRIEDRASEHIALGFYSRLVVGEGRAAALAGAQRDALVSAHSIVAGERFLDFEAAPGAPLQTLAHPRQWAAFRLTGAAGPVRR